MDANEYKAYDAKLTGGSRRRREDVVQRKGRKSQKQQSRTGRKTGGKSRRTGRKTGKR